MKTTHFSPVRWAVAFFVPTLPAICAAAIYTYLVDPLWQWPHSHHLERWHENFNERLQKTNYLASRPVSIDALIVGSSRSTYFRLEWLGTENGFNYAVAAGHPSEFAAYIDHAKKRSGTPIRLILVEAAERGMVEYKNRWGEPRFYIEDAEDEVKRIRNLFSLSALEHAFKTKKTHEYNYYLVNSLGAPVYRSANREFASAEEKEETVDTEVEFYVERIYSNPYDAAYAQYLADIHRAAGDAELIVYTPPVSWQLMKTFLEMGFLEGYEARLRQVVAEFGRVYHFFYPNAIVMDNASFNDANHPTAEAAELVMGIILALRSGETAEDTEHGGILLTEDNIEELLPRFRGEMEGLADLSY